MSESTTAQDIEKLKNPISELTEKDTAEAHQVVGLRAVDESGDPAGSQETPDPQESPEIPQSTEPYRPPDWTETSPPEHRVEGVPYDSEGKRPSEAIRNSIDFDELRQQLDPETFAQVEQRFRGLYRQVHSVDRHLNQLEKDNILFQEAQAQQEAVQQREVKKSELATALEGMDYERVAALLTDEPPQSTQQTDIPPTGVDAQTAQTISAWESETNEEGELLRPYTLDGHPLRDFAMGQATTLLQHPDLQNAPTEQVLAVLDNIMANVQGNQQIPQQQTQQQTRPAAAPQPLTSDPNIRPSPINSRQKITLDNAQKYTAERLFSGLPPAEAHAKYIGALKKVVQK